jgi:hypothetical protein
MVNQSIQSLKTLILPKLKGQLVNISSKWQQIKLRGTS